MPLDSISEARLSLVHPLLKAKVEQMAEMLADEFPFRVTQGLRTWDEQAALFAKGRTAPGSIVTDAPPGFSYHQFGLAVDVVPMTDIGPDWNIDHPQWNRLIAVGTSVGLTAGAWFRTFKDMPHFQLEGVLPLTPDDAVRSTFQSGGIEAVWKATQLQEAA